MKNWKMYPIQKVKNLIFRIKIQIAWRSKPVWVFVDIVNYGFIGALIYLQLIVSLFIMFIMAGRQPSSEVFVSAMGIGSAYYGLGSAQAFGMNAGFNVQAARCQSIKAYTHQYSFMRKQFYIVNVFNIAQFVYVFSCCFWLDAVYAHNPSLLYWTRVFMISSYPSMVILFNIDIFREMFVGLKMFIQSFIAETCITIIGVVLGYVFCFTLEFQLLGITFGLFCGQLIGFILYYVYYIYSKSFSQFHKKNNQKQLKDIKEKEDKKEQEQNEEKEEKKETDNEDTGDQQAKNQQLLDGNNVMTWKGFIVYESSFVILMFLLLLWNRLDTLIASFIFSESEIAAQCLFMNIVMVVDCFAYGFEFSITHKISYFIIKDDIKNAKKITVISNLVVLLIGIIQALTVYFCSNGIANCMINDAKSAAVLETVQNWYSQLIPQELLVGSINAIVKALNKQNHQIINQLVSNYIIHFITLAVLLCCTDLTNLAIVFSCGAAYLSMVIGGIITFATSDWSASADQMRKVNKKNDQQRNQLAVE